MQTVEAVYEKVRALAEKGRDVKSCCRSVAQQLHLKEEEVEVAVAGVNKMWYKGLGFDVRMKV